MSGLLAGIKGAHQKVLHPSGGCHNCPRKRVGYVPPILKQTKVLVVGGTPTASEAAAGKGFSGSGAEMLQTDLAAVGVHEYSSTYITHCRPAKGAAKPKEIQCCLSQCVMDEIRGYPIVVLCGTTPLHALFPNTEKTSTRATHYRGNVAWHPDFPGQRFYTIYDLGYIVRNPDLRNGVLRQELERLGRLVSGEPPPDWSVLQGGGQQWQAAFDAALAGSLLSVDIETTGLKAWEPLERIRSLAVTGDGKLALFVHEDEPHWVASLAKVRQYLECPEKAVLGSNIAFDLDWFEEKLEFESAVTAIYDLGVIWYQARQYKQPSLKELVSRELDGYRYLIYSPAQEQDLTLLSYYNAEDVIHGWRLLTKGLALLTPKTLDLVTRVLGPATTCLQEIKSTGFYVRRDYRQQQIDVYTERKKQALRAWHEADPEFLPTKHESGKGLQKYLFDIRGLPATARTEKGDASVDKMAVKGWIQEGATYLKHLLELREVEKVLSTYLTGYDKHLDRWSRVHSNYPLTRVDSGRTSSSSPNLQNIPRNPVIRDLFGAPAGACLLEADLSQIEFRIMVCLAQDPTGIAAYMRGEDAHTTTARAFTGGAEPTKEQRSRAKPVNFSLLYGGDWFNVQRVARIDYDLNWSQEECTKFKNFFVSTYERLPAFHEECQHKLILNRGWFESVTGHTFYYDGWDAPDAATRDHIFRAALNSEAQGPAAQICYAIMVYARRHLRARGLSQYARYVNHVHDSVLVEIAAEEHVPAVVDCIERGVAEVYEWVKPWFVVPLLMDYKLGKSWGSMEDYTVS